LKKDLDRLMKERGIDAITITGTPKSSRDMFYLTGPVVVTGCRVVKKLGGEPLLIAGSMERDEAARSGLEVKTYNDFDMMKIGREAKTPLEGSVKSFARICEVLGITGTVAFYGTGDIPSSYAYLSAIEKSGIVKVHAEASDSIFSEARMTKDNGEIDRMVAVNKKAQEVMAAVRDFLGECSEKGGKIVAPDGTELTIGRVKGIIKSETEARGIMIEEAVIFSQGRDSAVPHSRGDDDAVLVPGKTIVFDYCPQEAGCGYFADITRTWCLGHVPEDVQPIYEQVLEIQEKVLDALETGTPYSLYDKMTNEFFDEHGHPTPMKKAGENGYVHSLGHGLGLNVHERPRVSMFAKTEELVTPGHVFTVEPGLYYPDRGIGVRIEDDVAVREDGSIEDLTTLTKEILIPLK